MVLSAKYTQRNKRIILPCFGMHIWMVYIGASALPRSFLSIALGSPPHIIGWLKPPESMQCYNSVGKRTWLEKRITMTYKLPQSEKTVYYVKK